MYRDTFRFPNETQVNPLFVMASVLSMPDLISAIRNRAEELAFSPNSPNLDAVGKSIISDNILRESLLEIKGLKLPEVWSQIQNLPLPDVSLPHFKIVEYLPQVTPSGNVYLDFENACSHFLAEEEFKLSSNCSLTNLKLVDPDITISNQSQSYMLETYYRDHVSEPMVEGLECSNLTDQVFQLDDEDFDDYCEYEIYPLIACFEDNFERVCWNDQSELDQDYAGNWYPRYTSNFKLTCNVQFVIQGQEFIIPNVSVVLSPLIQNDSYGEEEDPNVYSGWCIHFENWPLVVGSLFNMLYPSPR